MKDCINPGGHQWSDKWWTEDEQAMAWQYAGRWSQSVITHFLTQTSQAVRCIYCNETGFLVKSAD